MCENAVLYESILRHFFMRQTVKIFRCLRRFQTQYFNKLLKILLFGFCSACFLYVTPRLSCPETFVLILCVQCVCEQNTRSKLCPSTCSNVPWRWSWALPMMCNRHLPLASNNVNYKNKIFPLTPRFFRDYDYKINLDDIPRFFNIFWVCGPSTSL